VLVAVLVLAAFGSFNDGAWANGGRPLSTILIGAEEVPGPGDPDGIGTAHLTLNPGQDEVCWDINVSNITLPATAAHIHIAPRGVAGPVVVPLSAPGADGRSTGCTSASRDLILDIIRNPENYYVNVHTRDYPAGAVRGQLGK
jgi:hypothetical protein